jgi:hypothetical protein
MNGNETRKPYEKNVLYDNATDIDTEKARVNAKLTTDTGGVSATREREGEGDPKKVNYVWIGRISKIEVFSPC